MKRVLINLLDNAIDATDGKGEIVLDLNYKKEEEIVKVEVADNGKGIQPDHKMRLFEPYFSTCLSPTSKASSLCVGTVKIISSSPAKAE